MMAAPLAASAALTHDYAGYIAAAYGMAAVLFVVLVYASVQGAQAAARALRETEKEAEKGGGDAA